MKTLIANTPFVDTPVPSPEADAKIAIYSLHESTTQEQTKSLPFPLEPEFSRENFEATFGPQLGYQQALAEMSRFTERVRSESILNRLVETSRGAGVSVALVLAFKEIDALMRSARFDDCDETLRRACLAFEELMLHDSVQLMIGLLTATLPIKSKLSSRPEFLRQVGSRLGELGLSRKEVLAGL